MEWKGEQIRGRAGKQVSNQALHHIYQTSPDEAEGVLELTGLHAHALHTLASGTQLQCDQYQRPTSKANAL